MTKTRSSIPSGSLPPFATWKELVRAGISALGGEASLQQLYPWVKDHVSSDALPIHYKAKVRQQVQLDPMLEHVSKGVWRIRLTP